MVNNVTSYITQSQSFNNRVLLLQVDFRSKIGKYLMVKAAQFERRKLRFLYDAVVTVCASCFYLLKCIAESSVIDKRVLSHNFTNYAKNK